MTVDVHVPKSERLLKRLDAGETTLGVLVVSPSPELVEILAYVGFDYVIADQMFTRIDWSALGAMAQAAAEYDMCVIGRVENDPWYGGGDAGISARVARTLGVGCDGVKMNVADIDQARRSMSAAAGWHRKLHLVPFDANASSFVEYESEATHSAIVIPSIESTRGIEQLEDMLRLDGLRVFGLALTDTSRMLGYPGQYEHPEVWRFIDKTAERARSQNVHLCAGTGYSFRTPEAISSRVARLASHGIGMIFLQTAEFLIQMSTSQLLDEVKAAIGESKQAASAAG